MLLSCFSTEMLNRFARFHPGQLSAGAIQYIPIQARCCSHLRYIAYSCCKPSIRSLPLLWSPMAKVQLTNVTVLDNPSPFMNPFQFEITFDCIEDLPNGRIYH